MKLYIRTFGCQMNVHDSARIADLLGLQGYSVIDEPKEADVILINTCSVREKARHKAVSEAGKMCLYKRHRPNLVVAVVGCVAQQEGEGLLKASPSLDLVVGPDHYGKLPALLDDVIRERRRQAIRGFDQGLPEDFLTVEGAAQKGPSAFLTIMKGCSRHCAYCIVPSVRGPERFRDVEGILKEARDLVDRGVKELYLLGQTVNCYKKDGVTFAALLGMLDQIPGLERLRFTSPHPRHMTDELISAYGTLRTLCESIHLPVQSGSDAVLKAMRRGYTSDFVREVARKLRDRDAAFHITTDLIVGFPHETEADFEETLKMYEDIRFTGAFSFKYSPRPGTKAEQEMIDDVLETEKSRRLEVLHTVINRIEQENRDALVGQSLEILVEGPAKLPGQLTGRARNNQIVNAKIPNDGILEPWIGRLLTVEITRALPHSLEGAAAEK